MCQSNNNFLNEFNYYKNDNQNKRRLSPLIFAMKYLSNNICMHLLNKKDIDINDNRNTEKTTALHQACIRGKIKLVTELLKKEHIKINQKNKDNNCPLEQLLYFHKFRDSKYIGDTYNVNEEEIDIEKVNKNHKEIINMLVDDKRTTFTRNLLEDLIMYFICKNDASKVDYLLKQSMNFSKLDFPRFFDEAKKRKYYEIIDLVLNDDRFNFNEFYPTLVNELVLDDKGQLLNVLLKNEKVDINNFNEAIDESDTNKTEKTSYTPLMIACIHSKYKIVEKLLQHPKIDVNLSNDHGETAFCYANKRTQKIFEKYGKI